MSGFRRLPLPSALEVSCGLLFALAAHLALSWTRVPAASTCDGGGSHGWTGCERTGALCVPRGLPWQGPARGVRPAAKRSGERGR